MKVLTEAIPRLAADEVARILALADPVSDLTVVLHQEDLLALLRELGANEHFSPITDREHILGGFLACWMHDPGRLISFHVSGRGGFDWTVESRGMVCIVPIRNSDYTRGILAAVERERRERLQALMDDPVRSHELERLWVILGDPPAGWPHTEEDRLLALRTLRMFYERQHG